MVRSALVTRIPSQRGRPGPTPRSRSRLRILILVLGAAGGLAALACTRGESPGAGGEPFDPTVILISLDGTTSADLARHSFFADLASRGASAASLVPVFPTNTFPNHVSLVTGVRPSRHGIVNNRFDDPIRGRYDYEADPTWVEVEPVWALADRHGIASASFHWVGSEGQWRNGHGPREWRVFSSRTPESEKARQILAWIDLPRSERPRLITAWFHGADHAGHRHGPGAPEVDRALEPQIAALASLVSGLEERSAFDRTTLLIVSDHGMAAFDQRIDLSRALAGTGVRVSGGGGFAIGTSRGDPSGIETAVELARELGLESWPRADAPPELFLDHPRFGDVVFLAPPGWVIGVPGEAAGGAHGYRPERPEMHGILLAIGRGAEPGRDLGVVEVLEVAPTLLALIGVSAPEWMEAEPIAALVSAVHGEEAAGTFREP
jgi:predicted AlkP superfamily pyrophosphatase or phosphodiesterase